HEIPVFLFPGLGWLRTYRFAKLSERVLKAGRFDLVVGFNKTWHQDIYLAVAGTAPASNEYSVRRFRNPVARGLRRLGKLLSPKQWLFRRIERKQFVDRSPHVVACSRFSGEHFAKYHGVPEERISVVYNGLDVARHTVACESLRADFRARH